MRDKGKKEDFVTESTQKQKNDWEKEESVTDDTENEKQLDQIFENFKEKNQDKEIGLKVRKSSMVLDNDIEAFISKANLNEVNFQNFNEL